MIALAVFILDIFVTLILLDRCSNIFLLFYEKKCLDRVLRSIAEKEKRGKKEKYIS